MRRPPPRSDSRTAAAAASRPAAARAAHAGPSPPRRPRPRSKLGAFLLKNFLVVGLLTAIAFSLACPWPGRAVNSVKVGSFRVFQTACIVVIFVIAGLTLRTDEIRDALRQWWGFLVGVASIMLVTPCAAFALVALPFSDPAYATGLAIFALTPTTIASGVTLVTAGRGNAALALMLTVTTNVLAVFTVPFTVPLVVSSAQDVHIDPASLLVKLVVTILAPLAVGKAVRSLWAAAAAFVGRHKLALSLLSNGSLICIVWQTLSAAQQDVVHTPFGTLCLVALTAVALHLGYLAVNAALVL